MDGQHLILWDGDCNFCRRCIDWVRRRDSRQIFRDSPYQTAPTPPMTPELRASCETAVHVVKSDGSILWAARAALFILGAIGHPVIARVLLAPPFVWFAEIGYRIVANNRDFFANFFFRKEPEDFRENR